MVDQEEFALPVTPGPRGALAAGWLWLALGALVVGGLFTILIVLSRTPFLQDIIPWVDFFRTALVVHVDLTVLVWFLAFSGVLWSINSRPAGLNLGWGALILAAGGAVIISAAPFLGPGNPLMNNYVPVLRNTIFFTGLGIFGLGFLLLIIRGLFFSRPIGRAMSGHGALSFALYSALVISLIAILSFGASWQWMPLIENSQHYFEVLFWGSGHVIQFSHTQLMLAVWLWLAAASGVSIGVSPRLVLLIFALGAAPVLMTPVIYFAYEIGSGFHMVTFTWLMLYGGGLAAVPIGLIIMLALLRAGSPPVEARAERSALIFSMILFGAGGIIGFMITGSNVTVPAHYHGSIVGVTLAFMGLTYHILPQLGFRKPTGKMLELQPTLYGIGQLLHVLGLAWSGGHGIQRKTAGAAQGLERLPEILGMGMMGLGGLIAIIGGVLFLIICFKAMWPKKGQFVCGDDVC